MNNKIAKAVTMFKKTEVIASMQKVTIITITTYLIYY